MQSDVLPILDSVVHASGDTLLIWLQRVERRHLEPDTLAVLASLQSRLADILEAQP